MSATTQAKPRGGMVNVRKWHIESMSANFARLVSADYRMTHKEERCHVVTGFSGSASQLKRLVEIAGMDDLPKYLAQKLWETSSLRHGLFMPTRFQGICEHVIRESLGLSTARKGRRK